MQDLKGTGLRLRGHTLEKGEMGVDGQSVNEEEST